MVSKVSAHQKQSPNIRREAEARVPLPVIMIIPLHRKTSPHGSMDASDSQSMMVFANSKQDPPKLVFENQTSLPASTTRNLLPDNDTLIINPWTYQCQPPQPSKIQFKLLQLRL
ncbi:hypothetical protein SAY87_017421 [Trapa incisa]|uniref:Uncharacterized protein n=1 Tax=Trapa incisa TaxID=236973 RepID=A0AAN7LHW4_9MYRT|nr:hypothetical protein SAY87_017421 [Trapa incisa]